MARQSLICCNEISLLSMAPFRTYPKTGGSVVEWRRTEQKFKGEEEEEESDDQNETVESQ